MKLIVELKINKCNKRDVTDSVMEWFMSNYIEMYGIRIKEKDEILSEVERREEYENQSGELPSRGRSVWSVLLPRLRRAKINF